MGMNIKNPETHRLAQELARLTGTSITEAVTQAIREKLKRIESPQKKYERLTKILYQEEDKLTEEERSYDYDQDLYDEAGLPK